MNDAPVIVALDYASADQAQALVARLSPARCKLKVGKELFVAAGPAWVRGLVEQGYAVFLDLKFHDIPHTVAAACRAAADLGVWMVNVHALGGRAMLSAAREALETSGAEAKRPKLIAVTILTSMSDAALAEVGIAGNTAAAVSRLAALTRDCGLDGVVCSAREASRLRRECGEAFVLVTPGIRPTTSAAGDQLRIATPAEAQAAGGNYLVIGRPITQAPDPLAALEYIYQELKLE